MSKSRFRFPFRILITLVLVATVHADQVDDYVRTVLAERHAPGIAVAVIKNGKVVKLRGYGLASVEFGVPVTTETVFEIGSVSKQMTAAAILLLVEDGKVSLDAPISTYIVNIPDAWKGVTVRHLLTHTSGVKSYTGLDGFELWRRLKTEDFIHNLSSHPLEFTPGERNIYSNSGYTLLGHIIQTVSGKPYMQFMRERIFTPLGMTKTADRDPQFIIPNRAVGYEWSIDRLTGRDGNLTDLMGAGSIVSTISDMVKWDAALNGKNFLKPESRAEWWKQYIFTNGKPSVYGFGWRISEIRGRKLIGHTGQTAGFGAANFRYVDDGVTVIVLTNLGEIGLGGQIATRIAKFYAPALSLKAVIGKPEPVAGLGEKLLAVLRARNEGTLDPAPLTPQLMRSLSTERAKANYRRIASLGAPANAIFVESDETGTRPTYRYRVEAGKRMFLWRVAVNDEGRISDLSMEEEE
ncbi:MAG: beta-lactamase family protein [Chloracidobacterium sp.]|nr:beta-lactamase family protein [Chloracidobacterium sp.]